MKFSQRKGLSPVPVDMQLQSVDEPLRNKLWSAIQIVFFDENGGYLRRHNVDTDMLMYRLWVLFFKNPVDTLPVDMSTFRVKVRSWFFDAEWYELYDFIEAAAAELNKGSKDAFSGLVNDFLEQEMAGYRFIGDAIADITAEEEVAAIQDALSGSESSQMVRRHLANALTKLTDRQKPDYRNSIKESISAVEAICQQITSDRKATLGAAIRRLKEAGVQLHPSLEQAWAKLYGFTSDHGGIRHAMSDESTVTFADAKYMLVICSAFISYLLQLAADAGISLESKPLQGT